MSEQLPRIVLTGGVSGGHTFPLIAVARVLRRRYPHGIELMFIGAHGSFEETAMSAESIQTKWVLYGKMRRYFSVLNYVDYLKVPIGCIQALWHMLWFMPDVVFGKGGAASVPVILAARLYRIPVLIHDSDAVAGRANIFLGKFVQKIAIAYPSAERYFPREKVALTGNPIREEILAGSVESARQRFQLDADKRTICIIGGSQGARGLNTACLRIVPKLLSQGFQIIHQTGRDHIDDVTAIAADLGVQTQRSAYQPISFLDAEAMGDFLSVADLVISRAGAGSIAEIAARKKALLLIPLPSAANDEQRKNAYDIAEIGAALVLEEANLGEHLFFEEIMSLMNNDSLRAEMGEKLKAFSHPDAAERIADGLIDLMPQ